MSAGSTVDADTGLFGPGSVTWRIHDDPSMLLAGFRTLMLQGLHPRAIAGLVSNSNFRDDPWGRLRRTGEWISTITYGSTTAANAAGESLRNLHARIPPITDPVSGASYRIDDPDLLLWVHCTEVESFLSTYRRSGGRLAPGEADTYVSEMQRSGAQVGLNPADLPATEADLEEYYRSVRPQLRVTKYARQSAAWGFVPPMPRWVALATPARPAWATMISISAAMMPRWARRMYGFPGLPTTDVAASVAGRAMRDTLLALPDRLVRPPAQREARDRIPELRT